MTGAFRDCPNLTSVTINSQASIFNEDSTDWPFNDIFDIDEETGESVPTVSLYFGSGAYHIGRRSGWKMVSLGTVEYSDGSLNSLEGTDFFGSEPQDENEGVVYKNAFDGDVNTHFDAHEGGSEGYVGIELKNPAKLTAVHLTPSTDGNYPGLSVLDSSGGFSGWYGGELPERLFDYNGIQSGVLSSMGMSTLCSLFPRQFRSGDTRL